MPLHGWQKDILLPSNWFFKKIEWKVGIRIKD